jgi:hypothetical protein
MLGMIRATENEYGPPVGKGGPCPPPSTKDGPVKNLYTKSERLSVTEWFRLGVKGLICIGTVFPLQDWAGPWGSGRLRLRIFSTFGTMKVVGGWWKRVRWLAVLPPAKQSWCVEMIKKKFKFAAKNRNPVADSASLFSPSYQNSPEVTPNAESNITNVTHCKVTHRFGILLTGTKHIRITIHLSHMNYVIYFSTRERDRDRERERAG